MAEDKQAVSDTGTASSSPETVTVVEGFGREITLELPIETVAMDGLSVIEAMTILGEQDRMVAIDWVGVKNKTLYGDLTNLPVVSSTEWYSPDFEMLYEVGSDLFITLAGPMSGFDDMVTKLEPGIPVVTIAFDTPEEITQALEMLGKIFQNKEAAAENIEFHMGTLDMIEERVADIPEEDKVRVFYEGGGPYFTMSKSFPAWHNHIAIPGGINIAADMQQSFGQIDPEAIFSLAIKYPLIGFDAVANGYDVDDDASLQAFHESILNLPELAGVSVVQQGRVYVTNSDLPITSAIGFAYFAKWLYPDRFSDLDLQAIHQENLNRFMRIDYDLNESGTFAYSQP